MFITDDVSLFWLIEAYKLPKNTVPQFSLLEWHCARLGICNAVELMIELGLEDDFYFGVAETIEWGEVPGVVSKSRKVLSYDIGSWSYSTSDFWYVEFSGELIKPP